MGKGKLKRPKPNQGKNVRVREGGGAQPADEWFHQPFRLTLRRLDFDGPFGWSSATQECYEQALRRLKELEGLTWREILNDQGKKNHRIERKVIAKVAQQRLDELGLGDSEWVYSFRVTGKFRLWGVREGRDGVTLQLLWCDPEHQVYPMNIADN